ncbi:MAG: hypothetical protein GZ085_14140 [Sulfuriferula multivorans]|uniref:Uncharacterized protein n=1 Tax=Sulfuriferula multivorans TaxID=1559896 RepID=A0A7C9P9N6_9PROT|nr:hypothetical protein [Sulfuriferula multivorans]
MQTPAQARHALRVAGITVPLIHPLFTASGGCLDPCASGFMVVHTGGGCMALRRDSDDFYMMITSEDGSDVPDIQELENSLIGVYRVLDGEEIACVTALAWKEVISLEADPSRIVA